MVSKPLLKPANLTDRVYAHLKGIIQAGQFSTDAPVFETQLAEALGVSRTPVREALKMLVIEGFLESVTGGGVRAFPLKPNDLPDVLLARIALEQVTARLAAERSDAAGMQVLDEVLALTRRAIREDRIDVAMAQNERFHRVIAAMTGTNFLERMVDRIYDYVSTHRLNRGFGARRWHKDTLLAVYEEHGRIAEAIRARDPERAARLMHDHLKVVGERYERNLESGPEPEPSGSGA